MAVVVLKGGSEASDAEIMEYCRSMLSSFKRPRSVVFVDSLSRNAMGKVLKKELRAKYGQGVETGTGEATRGGK
jgi:acyl-CoA synthetase (AMP-forming)/AMP-acid ligase II